MFRLAHISDIHLSPLPALSLRELVSKRITGYINWRSNRKGSMTEGTLDTLVAAGAGPSGGDGRSRQPGAG